MNQIEKLGLAGVTDIEVVPARVSGRLYVSCDMNPTYYGEPALPEFYGHLEFEAEAGIVGLWYEDYREDEKIRVGELTSKKLRALADLLDEQTSGGVK